MDNRILEQYADMLVVAGVNLQKGQQTVITADVRDADFVGMVAQAAYERGASNVTVDWNNEALTRMKYLRAYDNEFDACPDWIPTYYDYYDKKDACYIHVVSANPDLLKDVSPDRIKRWTKARGTALTHHRKMTMENHVRWTIGAVPSPDWARKVFPDLPEQDAVDRLWECIGKASRINTGDPLGEWETHVRNFEKRIHFLQQSDFHSLRYENGSGTNVIVELPDGHLWMGGAEKCKKGIPFSPNIPTEEIFTIPRKSGVNGRMVSSMPLSYNGVLIEGFSLDFKDGKVVDYQAEKNQDTLGNILSLDEGASYLGEIAIVPFDSPISKMNILFYNTLYDENASCHFALGKAYPCIKNYENMTKAEIEEIGVNDSITHVDFMVGTSDLRIIGIKKDGKETPVFINGSWA